MTYAASVSAYIHWVPDMATAGTVPKLAARASDGVYAAMAALTSKAVLTPKVQVGADTVENERQEGGTARITFAPLSVIFS
jgi:hypothetical protein